MNDDQYGDLHAWIEPEIEARLVALVLGEASDFEADELRRLMEERPELRVFKERLESVHGLLGDAVKPDDDAEWRLSDSRRGELLEAFGVEREEAVEALPLETGGRETRIRKQAARVAMMVAACLMVAVFLSPKIFKTLGRSAEAEAQSKSRELQLASMLDEETESILDLKQTPGLRRMFGNEKKAEPEEARRSLLSSAARAGGREASNVSDGLATMKKSLSLASNSEGSPADIQKLRRPDEGGGFNFYLNYDYAPDEFGAVADLDGDRFGRAPAPTAAPTPAPQARPVIPSYGVKPKSKLAAGLENKEESDDLMIAGKGLEADGVGEGAGLELLGEMRGGEGDERTASFSRAYRQKMSKLRVLEDEPVDASEKERASYSSFERESAALTEAESAERLFEVDGETNFDTRGWGSEKVGGEELKRAAVFFDQSGPDTDPVRYSHEAGLDVAGTEGVVPTEVGGRYLGLEKHSVEPVSGARGRIAGQQNGEHWSFEEVAQADTEWMAKREDLTESSFAVDLNVQPEVVEFEGFSFHEQEGREQTKLSRGVENRDKLERDESVMLGARLGTVSSFDGDVKLNQPSLGDVLPDSEQPPVDHKLWIANGSDAGVGVAGGEIVFSGLVDGGGAVKGVAVNSEPMEAKKAVVGFVLPPTDGITEEVRYRIDETDVVRATAEVSESIVVDGAFVDEKQADGWRRAVVEEGGKEEASASEKQKSDSVKRNLYTGEGLYNLGRFDQAMDDFEEVIKIDPYNAEARRWMERISDARSDYYRSAYDETRSRMLAEVDAAWKMEVPPAPGQKESIMRDDAVDRALQAHDAVDPERGLEDAQKEILAIKLKAGKEVAKLDATKAVSGGTGGGGAQTQTWDVPRDFERRLAKFSVLQEAMDDPFADAGDGRALMGRRPVREILEQQGIAFPEGAEVSYSKESGTLMVKNSEESLDLVDNLLSRVRKETVVDLTGYVEPLGEDAMADSADIVLTNAKLREIIIPVVDFEETTVEEALDFLTQRSRELDASGLDDSRRGVEFGVRKARVEGADENVDNYLDADLLLGGGGDPKHAAIKELKLRDVPVATVLQYIADQAGLRYKVEADGNVVMLPASAAEGEDPVTRAWKLHPDVLKELEDGAKAPEQDDPFADDVAEPNADEEPMALMDVMKDYGVTFPEGTKVNYLPDSQTLVVNNTPSNLDLVDVLIEGVAEGLALKQQSRKLAEEQGEKNAAQEAFSTFSLHVSDVSFKLAQASLAKGEWPEAERVRVEEFVNAFDYGDPSPVQSEKVACQVEQAAHPFMQQRNVMRIAMRTAAVGRASGTPLRLTILLDNSGSMERADRAEAVRNAFGLLMDQLNAQDEVTLISFARTPKLLRDGVSGDKAEDLLKALDETPSEGGTNLEEALLLGMEKASEHRLEGAQNRVILLTDGAANLGDAKPERLKGLVETLRQRGIAFDACGVGAEGLNDDILEALTRKGDGRYYFLDRPEDADAGFAKQIAGALRPAAKNVKVQVEFNPKRVGHYALYGFEKHELKKEDFRNDSVDAAELAAEEAGVAMYHVETLPNGEGDVGTVSVRFQDMETGEMIEKAWPIPYESNPAALENAAPSMKLAASAAFLGEALKGSAVGDLVEMGTLSKVTRSLQTVYPENERVGHLIEMVEKVREMK